MDLPVSAAQSWRLWLLTGTRRGRVDRRRLRGSHLGLKRALLDDAVVHREAPHGWKEFSDAMLRHAIGDAVGRLPEPDGQMLKLAYFGGCSNREIASQVGMTEAAVAARLRRAIDTVSDRIQRGGIKLRRAAYVVAAWSCGRWFETWIHNGAQAAAVAAAAVVVVTGAPSPAPVVTQPPSPVRTQPAQTGEAAGASHTIQSLAAPLPTPDAAQLALPAVAPVTRLVPALPQLTPPPLPTPRQGLPLRA